MEKARRLLEIFIELDECSLSEFIYMNMDEIIEMKVLVSEAVILIDSLENKDISAIRSLTISEGIDKVKYVNAIFSNFNNSLVADSDLTFITTYETLLLNNISEIISEFEFDEDMSYSLDCIFTDILFNNINVLNIILDNQIDQKIYSTPSFSTIAALFNYDGETNYSTVLKNNFNNHYELYLSYVSEVESFSDLQRSLEENRVLIVKNDIEDEDEFESDDDYSSKLFESINENGIDSIEYFYEEEEEEYNFFLLTECITIISIVKLLKMNGNSKDADKAYDMIFSANIDKKYKEIMSHLYEKDVKEQGIKTFIKL